MKRLLKVFLILSLAGGVAFGVWMLVARRRRAAPTASYVPPAPAKPAETARPVEAAVSEMAGAPRLGDG